VRYLKRGFEPDAKETAFSMRFGEDLHVQLGFASEKGDRARNEDYVAAYLGTAQQRASRGILAAVADGVGGARGGREAAEISVRSLIEGYYGQPATLNVERAAARAVEAANRWIVAEGQKNPNLQGMATTLSALILIGRKAHVIHVGDSRVYRFNRGRLDLLTEDHVHRHPDFSHVLFRAIGIENTVRLDHVAIGLETYDRFLLCTDGVHGALSNAAIAAELARGGAAEETACHIVAAALAARSHDNASALIIDINALPSRDWSDAESEISNLPINDLPKPGDVIDGFLVGPVLSDGRYCRLFRATDERDERSVVLKFPRALSAGETTFRAAFAREILIGGQTRSPWIGEILSLPPGRQTRLYLVMPYHDGETLEARLARQPRINLVEGIKIGTELAKAVASLHRAGIIHRDIKPDNIVLLKGGGAKLLDFGVSRLTKFDDREDAEDAPVPGTASYMAPEMRTGNRGDERTDLYALGITLYRALTGEYPYGEIEPFSNPRPRAPMPLSRHRPDLPAWLDFTLNRSFAHDPGERQGDVLELAFELENGLARGDSVERSFRPLYGRNPLLFWQVVSFLLVLSLAITWAVR
jgi:serine/threonine protein phosphatase PrpC